MGAMLTIVEALEALEAAQGARRAEIQRLHDEEGLTFAAIGALYGFTRARANRIYWRNMNKADALGLAQECGEV
jgi:predicted xylose isomerase-like sugar epimerase